MTMLESTGFLFLRQDRTKKLLDFLVAILYDSVNINTPGSELIH
jgi:hypothetical protein